MSSLSISISTPAHSPLLTYSSTPSSKSSRFPTSLTPSAPSLNPLLHFPRGGRGAYIIVSSKSSEAEEETPSTGDEWIKRLPDKKKPLYSHSLPCIEAWLKDLGFYQSRDDRAVWFVEKPDWHAQLSLDVTDLYIRYLKSGPGDLEKDVERRFSYALSREDIENALLGGP